MLLKCIVSSILALLALISVTYAEHKRLVIVPISHDPKIDSPPIHADCTPSDGNFAARIVPSKRSYHMIHYELELDAEEFLEKIINTHVYIASSVELPSHPRNKMLDHALAELLGCAPNNHPLSLLFASSDIRDMISSVVALEARSKSNDTALLPLLVAALNRAANALPQQNDSQLPVYFPPCSFVPKLALEKLNYTLRFISEFNFFPSNYTGIDALLLGSRTLDRYFSSIPISTKGDDNQSVRGAPIHRQFALLGNKIYIAKTELFSPGKLVELKVTVPSLYMLQTLQPSESSISERVPIFSQCGSATIDTHPQYHQNTERTVNMTRWIKQNGMHGVLYTDITIPKWINEHNCQLVLMEALGEGITLDEYELANLRRLYGHPNATFYSPQDLEMPSYFSTSHIVLFNASIPPSSTHLHFEVPIHFRYGEPSRTESSHKVVRILQPMVLAKCGDVHFNPRWPTHMAKFGNATQWQGLVIGNDVPIIEVRIPVGLRLHEKLVFPFTLLVIFGSMLLLLLQF